MDVAIRVVFTALHTTVAFGADATMWPKEGYFTQHSDYKHEHAEYNTSIKTDTETVNHITISFHYKYQQVTQFINH